MSQGYTVVERRAKGQSQSLAYGSELALSTCIHVAINYAGVQLHSHVHWALTCAFIISAEEIQLFRRLFRRRLDDWRTNHLWKEKKTNFFSYYSNYKLLDFFNFRTLGQL